MHLSSGENRLADLLSRWAINSDNSLTFFRESGLSADGEVVVSENLFFFENGW